MPKSSDSQARWFNSVVGTPFLGKGISLPLTMALTIKISNANSYPRCVARAAGHYISLPLCLLSGPKAKYECQTYRTVRRKGWHTVRCFKLYGRGARNRYFTDVNTEAQRSKQACLTWCDKWTSGITLRALDRGQIFWPHHFLRNQVPTEGESSSHFDDSWLSFTR